ncbi:MAG: elongation factor P [Planctomycetota bacterium]|jgi:elongation factor P
MPSATDIRKGSVLVLDGELMVCTDFHHSTPGNKRGNVQTKLKSLKSGTTVNRKFSSTERVEFAFLDKRPCEYLYKDGTSFVFMDAESYEQHHLGEDQVGEQMPFIVENTTAQVTFFEGSAVSVDLPGSVELKVTHTEPGIKGDSVSNVFKPATLETGLEIKVPNHVEVGDVVKVSTQTGEFQGRASG